MKRRQVGLVRDEQGFSTLAALKTAHEHPTAVTGFKYDFDNMKSAGACVLLLPCGRSAHLEAGWMAGAGKPVYVLVDGAERIEPELMYKFLTGLYDRIEDLINVLPDPHLGFGFKVGDRVRHRGPQGSYGKVLAKHPAIDHFYLEYCYGRDVYGELLTQRSLGVHPENLVTVPDEEYETYTSLPAFSEAQEVFRAGRE